MTEWGSFTAESRPTVKRDCWWVGFYIIVMIGDDRGDKSIGEMPAEIVGQEDSAMNMYRPGCVFYSFLT